MKIRKTTEIYLGFSFSARKTFFFTEWAGDLITRNVDVWTGFLGEPGENMMMFPPTVRKVDGWTIDREIFRYTWPYRVCTDAAFKQDYTVEWINQTLVNGIVLGGYLSISIKEKLADNLIDAARRYVRIRRELREKKHPVFPRDLRTSLGCR